MNQKVIITGLLFLFIFAFGFWLSRAGKPYNSLLFNAHKLMGVAMGIFLIVTVYRAQQAEILTSGQTLSIAVTVFLFVVTVATGGLLSAKEIVPLTVAVIHKVVPYLVVASTGATLYFLLFRGT